MEKLCAKHYNMLRYWSKDATKLNNIVLNTVFTDIKKLQARKKRQEIAGLQQA